MKSILIAVLLFIVSSTTAQTSDSTIIKNDSLSTKVDVEAQFPGGKAKFLKYYTKRVGTVIDKLEEQKYSGTCEISFVIDSLGNISNVQIVTCNNATFGYFLLDFFETSPRWIPARRSNAAVTSTKKEKFTFRSSANLKQ